MATYGIDIITGLPYLIASDEGTPVGEAPSATPSGYVYGTDIVTGEEYIYNVDGEVSTMLKFTGTGGTTVTQTDDEITIHSEIGSGGSGGTSLNGVGFVKANGTTITYDNSAYALDSHLHTGVYQPVGSYLTGTKVDSWNSRTGAVSLLKADVEGVLTGSISSHSHTPEHTHSNLTVLNAVSGTNTGDETKATIETKLTGLITSHTHNYGTGTVTSITATAPLTGGTISTSGSIGIQVATSTQNGYLSSTDWNTFNNKQPAGSYLTGTKVDSFNSRTGIVTLSKADVEGVLTGDISTHTHSAYSLTSHNHTGVYQPVGSYLTSFTETDPIFTASPAFNITSGNITSWNSAAASILPVDANGNLNIPATTTTVGMIMQNGSKLIHTFGTANLFVGINAGNTTITTGTQNTCIGTQAGRLFDTTSYNTAVGYQSLYYSATNAGENAAFGRMSLMYATGSYNSGLGNTSLGGVSFSGSYCVGIGKDAGRTLTTGGYNTFIGYAAGYNGSQLATASYSMALGNNAYTTKSYQVVLGASNITETILRAKVGIATESPTATVSIAEKAAINSEGGVMVKLTNKTGANTVKGTIVAVSSTTDNAFMTAPANSDMPFGIVYENGVADGSEAWVVTDGTAQVLIKNTIASTRGYVAFVSDVAGRFDISATAPATTTHFREIGHTLENVAAGTDVLVKVVLHFN